MVNTKISINGRAFNIKNLLNTCRTYRMIDDNGAKRGEHNVGYTKFVRYITTISGCDEETANYFAGELYAIQDWIDTNNGDDPPQQVIMNLLSYEQCGEQAHKQPVKQNELNTPRCPICGSTNVKTISSLVRYLNLKTAGLNSATLNKQMECKNCGYMF